MTPDRDSPPETQWKQGLAALIDETLSPTESPFIKAAREFGAEMERHLAVKVMFTKDPRNNVVRMEFHPTNKGRGCPYHTFVFEVHPDCMTINGTGISLDSEAAVIEFLLARSKTGVLREAIQSWGRKEPVAPKDTQARVPALDQRAYEAYLSVKGNNTVSWESMPASERNAWIGGYCMGERSVTLHGGALRDSTP